jgi:uncharacterized protein YndB with AHSA1/START domain
MTIDIAKQIGAISRQVEQQHSEAGEIVTVTMERRYPAEAADVWQAITDPERVRRWLLPVTGDFRQGGNFQLEGNAGGDIVACEPPRHLMVTFGAETSIVEVLLSADGEQTLLKLAHSVPIELAGSAAGALYVGPGWDGALLGLGLYLAGEAAAIPSLRPTVPRYRTSMSGRSRSGLPSLSPRERPTPRQLRLQSRPRWLSSPPMSFGQSDSSLPTCQKPAAL